jgi:hypothetical protein
MQTKPLLLSSLALLLVTGCMPEPRPLAVLTHDSIISEAGIVLKGSDRLSTPATFKPPLEITIVAQTDSTNLRMAYTADQVIFNWEMDPTQLRVDGGPADGLHKPGAGGIPRGKFVTIRWEVRAGEESIYVDGDLRFQHTGDYSGVNKAVSVFPANGSQVTVKSIKVKQLDRN